MFRLFRVIIALVVVVINVLVTFVVTLSLGLVCAPLRSLPLFSWLWLGLEQIPRAWNFVNWKIACEGILGMEMVEEVPAPPLPAGAVRIFMANHPTFVGFAAFGYVITACLRNLIVLMMKVQVLWHPFVMFPALCLWVLRAAVFINRKKRKQAFAAIQRAVRKFRGQLAWVCFGDQHRTTPERLESDYQNQKFLDSIPDLRTSFTETLVPRSGGILQLWEGLKATGVQVQLLDVTMGFGTHDAGFKSLLGLVGAKFYVHYEDVTAEAAALVDEKTWQLWLVALWREKNQRLRRWKGKQ